jgi:hypothetical protein
VLSIDNIPCDTCTVDEGIRLLQRSTDIVKLRIKKAAADEDDENGAPQTIVYAVC